MGFNPSTKKQTTIFINRDGFQPIYKKNKQQYSSIEMGFNPSTKKTNNNWALAKINYQNN
jgi:hypothetical protein